MTNYFFFACDNAEPAALLEAALVRPSCRTFEAAVAAFAEVTLLLPVWDNVLPAADFEAVPVEELDRTLLAFLAAAVPVTLVAMDSPG
jgi:hypothetical protein